MSDPTLLFIGGAILIFGLASFVWQSAADFLNECEDEREEREKETRE